MSAQWSGRYMSCSLMSFVILSFKPMDIIIKQDMCHFSVGWFLQMITSELLQAVLSYIHTALMTLVLLLSLTLLINNLVQGRMTIIYQELDFMFRFLRLRVLCPNGRGLHILRQKRYDWAIPLSESSTLSASSSLSMPSINIRGTTWHTCKAIIYEANVVSAKWTNHLKNQRTILLLKVCLLYMASFVDELWAGLKKTKHIWFLIYLLTVKS